MLEKIKDLGESAKSLVLYVLTPVAFVLGVIYYLLTRNHELEDALKAKEGEGKLNELRGKQDEIDLHANDSMHQYEKLRDSYLRGGNPGSEPGYPRPEDTNHDS